MMLKLMKNVRLTYDTVYSPNFRYMMSDILQGQLVKTTGHVLMCVNCFLFSELEAQEQAKKERETTQATTPDYAASLMSPAVGQVRYTPRDTIILA